MIKKVVSKDVIIVLLITAILLSAATTYITIANFNEVPRTKDQPSNTANLGIIVKPTRSANIGINVLPANEKEGAKQE